jgi:secondary thiamine-phosphate synthase enzyme
MRQATTKLKVTTRGRGFTDVTTRVISWVKEKQIGEGLLTIFIRHTSASLLIQENADPDVQRDMAYFFGQLVPDGAPGFRHILEGPDDMPAHIRSALTQTHLSIPVIDQRPALGTWQGIYLYEHRTSGHDRTLVLHLMGE